MGGERSEACYAGEMKRVDERLTANARALRNNATKAERLLWRRLSSYRPRFTRQLVVDPYIVDIACREAKLVIELDGSQHIEADAYDFRRTQFLEREGWIVIRLWNNDVTANPDGAADPAIVVGIPRAIGAGAIDVVFGARDATAATSIRSQPVRSESCRCCAGHGFRPPAASRRRLAAAPTPDPGPSA